MSCNCGKPTCGDCRYDYYRDKWRPTTTVARACELIHTILGTVQCGVVCPDHELCRLLRWECNMCHGRYPVATLAMLVAARMLETEAIGFARKGSVKTLTIQYDGNKTSQELQDIAKTWRETALSCVKRTRFAIVGTGRSCLSQSAAYGRIGCYYKRHECDDIRVSNCNWDCCDDCT